MARHEPSASEIVVGMDRQEPREETAEAGIPLDPCPSRLRARRCLYL